MLSSTTLKDSTFDENENETSIFDRVYEIKNQVLIEEEEQIAKGTHPEMLEKMRQADEQYKLELEMLEIMEKNEIERIELAYKAEEEALEREYQQKLNELAEIMINEVEDKKRQVENEIHGMDIAGNSAAQSNYYYNLPNKKTLRRRTQEQVLESSEKKGVRKSTPQTISQLLSDADLAEDVRLMCGGAKLGTFSVTNGGSGSTLLRVNSVDGEERQRKVSMEHNRLIYEGKTFHRGQSVTIQSMNYGKFSAILQAVTDKYAQFRSSIAGDTRQVTATKDDLESGRVVVRKRY